MFVKAVIRYLPYLAFIQVLIASLGSLYSSEILKLAPCKLCWEQRIAMYPLIVILFIGILRKDKGLLYYVLPLSVIGMIISLYQNLLYFNIISENLAPCTSTISCTQNQGSLFGFITIPMLSFAAFTFITLCMIIYAKFKDKKTTIKGTKN